MKPLFSYSEAFSRNIGWLTHEEQERLRTARVAIAGLGGVGGAHLLTLTRLGVGRFSISDFDTFGVHNFNRQAGAFLSSVGRPKIDVLSEMALDINPEAELRRFPEGINSANLDAFLEGVDLYVDGIDFFALDIRRSIFDACRDRGIPAITAAPLGMGVSLLYFSPSSMSFEDYFKLRDQTADEQYARFIAGLSPAMLQRTYLVAPDAVNFLERRGPSTGMACELCAGVAATAALKILLKRGPMRPAPWSMQFDAYRQRLKFCWRPWGNSNPLQRLLLALIRPILRGTRGKPPIDR